MYNFPDIHKVYHQLSDESPVMTAWYPSPHKHLTLDADAHYNLQMCMVLRGRDEAVYSDYRTRIGPGQLWWTACWEPHAFRILVKDTDLLVITLLPELVGSASPFRDVNWLAPFFAPPADRPQARTPAARQTVLTLARAILDLMQRQPPGWRTLQWLKIHELLVFLTTNWHPPQTHAAASRHAENVARLLPAIQRIMNHPETLSSLTESAQMCGLSSSHFSALFSKTMGASFKQYVLNVRLAGASRLLRTTRLPIKAVARQCGFMSVTHFHHAFSRHFHVPPAVFRLQASTMAASALNVLPNVAKPR